MTRAPRPGAGGPLHYDSAVNPPAPTALIMAAGEGTRMHSAVPKVLHEVCGRPMIAWPILAARDAGAGRICVIVSPEGDLSSVLPEGTETVVQPEPDGTGGALRAAAGVVRDSERFSSSPATRPCSAPTRSRACSRPTRRRAPPRR